MFSDCDKMNLKINSNQSDELSKIYITFMENKND